MTQEKKKKGRPRKVNPALEQAAKDIEFVTLEIYDAEKLGKIDDEYVSSACKSIGQSIPSEKLLPPAGLSKVATLQWLTEKNAKK